jgi:hypothetical protein
MQIRWGYKKCVCSFDVRGTRNKTRGQISGAPAARYKVFIKCMSVQNLHNNNNNNTKFHTVLTILVAGLIKNYS